MAAIAVPNLKKSSATRPVDGDLQQALPLYGASLLVTLAGIGAVGVTVTVESWTGVWVLFTLIGHAVSLFLRSQRVPQDAILYPVMILGTAAAVQLALMGSPLVGLQDGLMAYPIDMATATLVGMIAGIRSFTLVTNGSLLFSPVPAITMLALVGSTNPNAEVPIFFGILVLGSLFSTGFEANLRRAAATSRKPAPPFMFLIAAWVVTLAVSGAALLFPVLIQPVIGPYSPFALPAMTQIQQLINFTQSRSNQTPVGRGPIRLSETPVYEMRAPEAGLVRTRVFTNYTGRGWQSLREPSVDLPSETRTEIPPSERRRGASKYRHTFTVRQEPQYPPDVAVRRVEQKFTSMEMTPDGIPGVGRIIGLEYGRPTVSLQATGVLSGNSSLSPGSKFTVVSEVPEFPPQGLRASPNIDPSTFEDPEALEVPNSTQPLQSLARELSTSAPTAYDKVQTFIDYINSNTTYTLDEAPTPDGEDAAVYYLFRTKRGACDLSATALTMLCRSVGVPARVAVGYLAEEPLSDGSGYLLRQSHAHMWTEVFFQGYGWVPFNPSPALSDLRENPMTTLFKRVRDMFSRIGGGGLDAVLLVTVTLFTLAIAGSHGLKLLRARMAQRARLAALRNGSPAAATALAYEETLRFLEQKGWGRQPWMTASEYRAWLQREWSAHPELIPQVDCLTDAFQSALYAGDESQENLDRARSAAAELRRLTPAPPRPPRPRARAGGSEAPKFRPPSPAQNEDPSRES